MNFFKGLEFVSSAVSCVFCILCLLSMLQVYNPMKSMWIPCIICTVFSIISDQLRKSNSLDTDTPDDVEGYHNYKMH